MTRERIVIALLAFSALLGVLYFDYRMETHLASLAALALFGTLAQLEIYPLFRRMGLDSLPTYGALSALALFLWRGLGGFTGLPPEAVRELTWLLLAFVVCGPFVKGMFVEGARRAGGREEFERAAVTLLGLLMVWFLLSFVLELRMLDDGSGTTRLGLELTTILVLSVKVGDSTAYLVGRSIGVTPLSWVSPKKTWEGAAGSVAGAVAVTLLGGALLLGFSWWQMLCFGILTNAAGQLGDLVESLLKRRSGVKDSGTLLREIGGFLDLTDSLLLAAPVGYLFVRLVVL